MPMPTEERVRQLVAGLVERRGFDLEGVAISAASGGGQARIQLVVDRDEAADLDTIAELSRQLSELLDEAGDFGEAQYLLEVTTPGIDRPLTEQRHWRRARGRKARIELQPGVAPPDPGGRSRFEARIGAATAEEVALVLGGKRSPHRLSVPYSDIAHATVLVEFSAPGVRELELAGGVVPGRPSPGRDDGKTTAHTAGAVPQSVAASDSSTEGIVE